MLGNFIYLFGIKPVAVLGTKNFILIIQVYLFACHSGVGVPLMPLSLNKPEEMVFQQLSKKIYMYYTQDHKS